MIRMVVGVYRVLGGIRGVIALLVVCGGLTYLIGPGGPALAVVSLVLGLVLGMAVAAVNIRRAAEREHG